MASSIPSHEYLQQRLQGDLEDDDIKPPFRLLTRPAQFPQGKTATAIEDMKFLVQWLFDKSKTLEVGKPFTEARRFKRIVHLVFVNNNLIEGDQWQDRLFQRGVQNLKIFSSKSDTSDVDNLNTLIGQGEFINGKYVPVNYVLMCTHPVRLCNFTGEKNGDSLLRRFETFHPDIGFICWFDEIDKFVSLLKDHIPRFQSFNNVLMMTGITATPYKRFWDIMHKCGYYDVELVGELPEASDYMTFQNHEIIYSDMLAQKSPVKNFRSILENPGYISYLDKDSEGNDVKHLVPDLTDNHGDIIFVPGESARKTHIAIRDIAVEWGKNALVINGSDKSFYRALDHATFSIYEYKKEKIRQQHDAKKRGENLDGSPVFENMTAMDVAVHMYNDPALDLKSADLVITGFYCVERGVTFNRPGFQFRYAILAPYHLRDGSEEIESIVQLSGRTHGSKSMVRKITVISPKYIVEEVNDAIKNLIDFLRSAPSKINYACIYRQTNGIPIRCSILDDELVDKIRNLGKLTEAKRDLMWSWLKKAHENGTLVLIDKNISDPSRLPFSFADYSLKGKRILENEDSAKTYRFPQFYDHFLRQKVYGQSIRSGEFDIDINTLPTVIDSETTLPSGTAFISFAFKPKIE